MSRHHQHHYSSFHSPYAGARPAARWPWVVGLLIVAAFAAVGAVLLRGDLVDLGAADLGQADPPVATVPAAVVVPTAADVALDVTADPTATPAQAQAQAQAQDIAAEPVPTDAAPAADPTAPPAAPTAPTALTAPAAPAAPTASPAPTPTPEPRQSPAEVATDYLARWSAGDYDGLYDLIAAEAQTGVSRADFVERYEAIAAEAGLTRLTATVTGEPNLQTEVPIRVEIESSAVGTFAETNRVPLTKQDGEWRVAWTPTLIFKDLGADGCVDLLAQPAGRGRILDRTGEILAFDGPVTRVGVVPGLIEDERAVLRELAKLTGFTESEIKARYADQPAEWFVPIKDFPQTREQEILNAAVPLKGVGVQPHTARVYPLGPVAAHVTGYVAAVTAEQIEADPSLTPGQIVGQAGIEAGADDLLTGEPGGRLVVVQCETRAERNLIAERKPIPAKDVILSLDVELQRAVDAAMTAQGKDLKGAAVVLDPRDGGVLAMVSHPTFDPNGFVLGFSAKDGKALTDEKARPLLNRTAQAALPTGSIFKPITTAAAMEHLGYTADTPVYCPSTFSLDGSNQIWEDWTVAAGMGEQGNLSLHQALVNSCNTVFYGIGRDLDLKDDELLPNMAKAFGLGAPTDIPYLAEVGGTVPDPTWKLNTFTDYWATGDAVNLAIGQGFLEATPLQMAVVYAAIANGGDVLRPFLVAETAAPGGAKTREGERTVRAELPLSAAQVQQIQTALRSQTSDPNGYGSVRVFGDFDWPIAGKTGTAQDQTRANRGEKPHSWFASFGPYGEEATIATAVMIENAGEGVSFAAPITRRVYEAYLDGDLG